MIPVHLYGMPARMDALSHIARKNGLFVLEDCAQAHGAIFRGRQVGSLGHAASFSFFPERTWAPAGMPAGW